jgi:hypothetical protein
MRQKWTMIENTFFCQQINLKLESLYHWQNLSTELKLSVFHGFLQYLNHKNVCCIKLLIISIFS